MLHRREKKSRNVYLLFTVFCLTLIGADDEEQQGCGASAKSAAAGYVAGVVEEGKQAAEDVACKVAGCTKHCDHEYKTPVCDRAGFEIHICKKCGWTLKSVTPVVQCAAKRK